MIRKVDRFFIYKRKKMNKIGNAKVAIKKPADIRGMGPDLLPGEWKFEAGKLLFH